MGDPAGLEQGTTLGVMSERLRNLDATIVRLEKRLFGNGTPGELAKLDERTTSELEKLDARTTSVERMVWKIQGIGMLVVILIEALSHFVIKH
jgi:hypothetical protein